ncbi:MAG: TolC family protein [Planctomycetaceae bacterium]|nr:TolC family protein [Planctomycetaceae bacterium]
MNRRPVPVLLIVAASLLTLPGCRSFVMCCNNVFAWRNTVPADLTPVPAGKTIVDSSTGKATIDGAESDDPTVDAELTSAPRASDDPAAPQRFEIPKELLGASARPLQLPPIDRTQSIEQRRSLMSSLFPEIPEAQDPATAETDGLPLSLAELQQLAADNSPVVRQAVASVEMARGQAVQAGLYPNPTVGYEGDSLGTGKTAGYNGIFLTQEFVTADKLQIAQNAQWNAVRAAQADLRKARVRLATDVRRQYFQVLLAQEQLRLNQAIAKLSAEVYQAQIDLVTGGEAAPYEPLQLRVFAVQARNQVIQSQNNLDAAWRQLAAAVGLPEMSRRAVQGSVESPVPELEYGTALGFLLSRHSDIVAAQARISQASCNLELQQVTPIPNITFYATVQHDDTSPLNDVASNLQLSVPVPVFDRNQGNTTTAHARLVQANQDLTDARNSLTGNLAEAYNRYQTHTTITRSYQTDLLPDQVRVYRGVYDRFRLAGDQNIDFAQVVVAQQTLSQTVTSYLQSLSDQWNAVIDLAELLQVDDLVTMDGAATPSTSSENAEETLQ